ncbi:MAG: pseudaminic acid synthase [Candidatus Omnitrophica bacterium]|nr:pseudaminic acid synthase [Candidatus Omnitrophota bacterium]
MRIVFLGNNWVAWQALRWLKAQGELIVGLVVHPPHKQRYGEELLSTVAGDATKCFDGSRLREPGTIAAIRDLQVEMAVSVSFGYRLDPSFLALFPRGVINLHAGYLPYNRGTHPNIWSIVEGTPAGATLHYVDAGIDTGDIIAQRAIPVEPTDTGETLYRKLERVCMELLMATWPSIRDGTAPRHPQPSGGTAHQRRDVERIDEIAPERRYTARELIDILRARTFPPYPGAYLRHGGQKISLRLSAAKEDHPAPWLQPTIDIGCRRIGAGYPTYIVAEISANHNQDFELAVKLLQAAKAAGADAVKLQTYTPETMTIPCHREPFQIKGTLWDGQTLYDLYRRAYTPWEWHPKLKAVANEMGLDLFSTAFDATAVDFLESLGVPVHKVASFEMVDLALLAKMALTGKPVILSTGMATFQEIAEAVQTVRGVGATTQVALLKCTSAYPALPEEMNLRAIPHLTEQFQVPVGLSDHTLGTSVALAAVALGACMVEKHLTLSRSVATPDAAFSLEPDEFKAMVKGVREVERALGEVRYGVSRGETQSQVFRRSLFVVRGMKAGEVFSERNVRSIRPGYGLHPRYLKDVLGRQARCDIAGGTPFAWKLVDPAGAEAASPEEPSAKRVT